VTGVQTCALPIYQYRGVPLSVIEFIRRWLMHVLPTGLHRVRYYGYFHHSSSRSLEEVKWLVAVALMNLYYLTSTEALVIANAPKLRCPQCGGAMRSLGYFPPIDATPFIVSNHEAMLSWLPTRAPP
jgi:hypothetical protein